MKHFKGDAIMSFVSTLVSRAWGTDQDQITGCWKRPVDGRQPFESLLSKLAPKQG